MPIGFIGIPIVTQIAGEAPKVIRQPKIIESDKDRENWEERTKNIEEMTQRILMGSESRREFVPAKPGEKRLWEALKRAKTGTQVRRIVKKSRIWLIWRITFPKGGFVDWGGLEFQNPYSTMPINSAKQNSIRATQAATREKRQTIGEWNI